jgi:hypothetical protein
MPIYRARQLVRSWALVTWSNSAGTSAWQTTATRRLRHARETQAALITRELDFADVRRYPPEQHAGIVVLRRPDDAVAFEIVNVLVRFTRNPASRRFSGRFYAHVPAAPSLGRCSQRCQRLESRSKRSASPIPISPPWLSSARTAPSNTLKRFLAPD